MPVSEKMPPRVGGRVLLVPFAAGSGFGASTPFEVVANVALFVPFGLYLGLLAPSLRWWNAAAGGLAGIGILALARRRLRARTTLVMTRVRSIGTVVALLLAGIFVASPLRHAPPRDVPGAPFPPAGDHTR